jgi:hypothetical protein
VTRTRSGSLNRSDLHSVTPTTKVKLKATDRRDWGSQTMKGSGWSRGTLTARLSCWDSCSSTVTHSGKENWKARPRSTETPRERRKWTGTDSLTG